MSPASSIQESPATQPFKEKSRNPVGKACWLAQKLDAEKLVLIKSQAVQQHEFDLRQHSGLLDDYFPQASTNYRGQISLYHASQSELVCEQISDE